MLKNILQPEGESIQLSARLSGSWTVVWQLPLKRLKDRDNTQILKESIACRAAIQEWADGNLPDDIKKIDQLVEYVSLDTN